MLGVSTTGLTNALQSFEACTETVHMMLRTLPRTKHDNGHEQPHGNRVNGVSTWVDEAATTVVEVCTDQ